jgi:RimJ/RimL family protein N-acetyltransferase
MREFTGNATAIALQKSLLGRAEAIAGQPHLSNGGRILNVLDPDGFGWTNVRDMALRDGYVALVRVDRAACLAKLHAEFGENVTAPDWALYESAASDILSSCAEILAPPLPGGWRMTTHRHLDNTLIGACQNLHQITDVAAFPAWYLRGDRVQSFTACLWTPDGTLAACALSWFRFHPDSALGGWLYAGAISVHPDHRRKGLGTLVNAAVLQGSHGVFGWTHACAFAREANLASVGMLEKCGLRLAPGKATFVLDMTGAFHTS